jgi:hypothetical protein
MVAVTSLPWPNVLQEVLVTRIIKLTKLLRGFTSMTGSEVQAKRIVARIDGHTVCARIKKCRSWLSDVELERITPTQEELKRVSGAIDAIIAERHRIAAVVASEGLSLTAVGF